MCNDCKVSRSSFNPCNSLSFPQVYQVKGVHKIVILDPAGFLVNRLKINKV